ncbi:unnamed protein product [Durusdinium trenchii]|uniref:ShKT domain-containing protein n=1 Tax=Durusdinium trenchii TaxID=1381693 RepID=A0ABP0QNA7_9DINO
MPWQRTWWFFFLCHIALKAVESLRHHDLQNGLDLVEVQTTPNFVLIDVNVHGRCPPGSRKADQQGCQEFYNAWPLKDFSLLADGSCGVILNQKRLGICKWHQPPNCPPGGLNHCHLGPCFCMEVDPFCGTADDEDECEWVLKGIAKGVMLLFGLCLVLSNVLLDATLSPDMDILPGILKTLGLPKNKLLRYEVYKEQIRNGALSCNRINDHEFHVKFRGLGGACHVIGIYFQEQKLTGQLSAEMSRLTKLRTIHLEKNQLTGPIPDLRAVESLSLLNLSANQLSGPLVALPSNLRLAILSNNQLNGSLPELMSLRKLEKLYVMRNNLSGFLPELGEMKALQYVSLEGNRLEGPIPKKICNSGFRYLSLAENRLTGTIPPELWRCSRLKVLKLAHNQLEGAIPPLPREGTSAVDEVRTGIFREPRTRRLRANDGGRWGLEMTRLLLNNNRLQGEIPCLKRLTKLKELNLGGNRFKGAIGSLLESLLHLEVVDLSLNGLTGAFPDLMTLTELKSLSLHHNHLIGEVSASLANLTKLQDLMLDHNHLTGAFPEALCQMPNLQSLHLNHNRFTGKLPDCFEWPSSFRILTKLFLSNNQFHGPIPRLTGFERLAVLTLHDNGFSGHLPDLSMTQTSVVTFHNNQFSGKIPNMNLWERCIDNDRFKFLGKTCKQVAMANQDWGLACEEISSIYHIDNRRLLANCPKTCGTCWSLGCDHQSLCMPTGSPARFQTRSAKRQRWTRRAYEPWR